MTDAKHDASPGDSTSTGTNMEPTQPTTTDVIDSRAEGRIELTRDGYTAFVAYRRVDRQLIFTHTEVPDEFRGQGVGSELVRGALEIARERELEVVPLCPFVASYLQRHPEYRALVSAADRRRLRLDEAAS